MTDMPTTYEYESRTTTTTTTTASGSQAPIRFDPTYATTIPGILKILEIVFSIITFICSVSVYWSPIGGGWVDFVSMTAFIYVLILLLFYLFGLMSRIPAQLRIIELICYIVITVLFLIAAIVAAVRGHLHGAIGAAAFFAFASTLVFAIDTFLQLRDFKYGTTTTTASSSGGNTTVVTETRQATY